MLRVIGEGIVWFVLFLTLGCAGLKVNSREKAQAELWIRKANNVILSATKMGSDPQHLLEARSYFSSAHEFYAIGNYKSAALNGKAAEASARDAIEEVLAERRRLESIRSIEFKSSKRSNAFDR